MPSMIDADMSIGTGRDLLDEEGEEGKGDRELRRDDVIVEDVIDHIHRLHNHIFFKFYVLILFYFLFFLFFYIIFSYYYYFI